MIIAQKKEYLNLLAKLLIIFGLVFCIGVGVEIEYERMYKAPFALAFIAIAFLSVFFVLPGYILITSTELKIDTKDLTLRKQPFNRERKYDLLNLEEWELKYIPTRYSLGNHHHLYLRFADKKQLHLSDMKFTNFDKVIGFFDTEFKKKKKKIFSTKKYYHVAL